MGFLFDLPFGMQVVIAIGVAQAVVCTLGLIHGNIAFWSILVFALFWFGGIYLLVINGVDNAWVVAYAVAVLVGSFWLTGKMDDIPVEAIPGGDWRLGILAAVFVFAAFAL